MEGKPGTRAKWAFSPLDQIMPAIEETALLTFSMPSMTEASKNKTVEILTKALTVMCADMPFLLDRIVREHEPTSGLRLGLLKWERPVQQRQPIPLIVNDMTTSSTKHQWKHSYKELVKAGMPSSLLGRETLGPPMSTEQAPLVIQANFIPGGCLLFVLSSHVFCDAWGFWVMCDLLAKYCRRVQCLSVEKPAEENLSGSLGFGEASLSGESSGADYEELKQRPELWQMLGLDWRPKEQSWGVLLSQLSPPKAVRTCIFALDPISLSKLKDEASAGPTEEHSGRISTNDALIALLWRCILKVRVAGGRQMFLSEVETMHMVAMNARQQLSPPIPHSYPGNVVLYSMARLSIDLITAPDTPLFMVSRAVRQSLDANRDPQLIRDAVDLAASIPNIRQLGLAFPTWLAENLVTSSISGIPFYDLDFGETFGETKKADFFRYPKGGFEGLCFMMPRQRNGVVELFVSMEASQMDGLIQDEQFSRYAKFVAE
ncbi:MAG: hypothetical protein HETSPECPRED_002624 [Heterodermia speciosa]|uniref:Uncharacterized protein n=1 Tax=Heterodermia speciosa TaxID=116794 RepID=A0A8H3PI01_9LECA|nr:MAG: hypothetical protein HETSPECPRED_002624 [Heterodermia speciosa]